mgnify:CR=1 FL=1
MAINFGNKIDSQIILAGDFKTGEYYTNRREGKQFNIEYLGVFSNSASSVKHQNVSQVLVYPNPAKDALVVNGSDVKELEVLNINGQKFDVNINKFEDKTEIDIAHLKTGNYLIRLVKLNGDVLSSYFVKQ